MEKVTHRLHIHGHVQGVFYRESMRQRAEELGITGWVRNRADGSVEAVVQGVAESVREITAWARKGPPQARVVRVEIDSVATTESFTSFERLPSA